MENRAPFVGRYPIYRQVGLFFLVVISGIMEGRETRLSTARKGVIEMGVKHGRDYGEILAELTEAVGRISDSYVFFEMEAEEWNNLGEAEKTEVHEALAEDLFYALGTEPVISVGSGVVMHDQTNHRIHILIGEEELAFVALV
jgi:hypothetical protein